MTTPTMYRVTAPCVTAKGVRGSHGIFYADQPLTSWTAGDQTEDHANEAEIQRLLDLGFIEPA